MPDNLHPYTVSAVVDTRTGELVGTPVIRHGHENYHRFETVKPLAATEQFRWIHVWAPDRATAETTDALTADLRPGGNRRRPAARALTGAAGLKPYSVAAVVQIRTGRPIGEPVVAEGHHTLSDATIPSRPGEYTHLVHVWARDRTDAAAQIFGTLLDAHRTPGSWATRSARGDPTERGQIPSPGSAAQDAAATPMRTPARLAREDRAAGAATRPVGAPSSRARTATSSEPTRAAPRRAP